MPYYTNKQIGHKWLYEHESLGSGKTSNGNMFFEGNTIYSYGHHYPLATVIKKSAKNVVIPIPGDIKSVTIPEVKVPQGKAGVVFLSLGNYSPSTAKHRGHIQAAMPHYSYEVIYVNDKACAEEYSEIFLHDFDEKMAEATRALNRKVTANRLVSEQNTVQALIQNIVTLKRVLKVPNKRKHDKAVALSEELRKKILYVSTDGAIKEWIHHTKTIEKVLSKFPNILTAITAAFWVAAKESIAEGEEHFKAINQQIPACVLSAIMTIWKATATNTAIGYLKKTLDEQINKGGYKELEDRKQKWRQGNPVSWYWRKPNPENNIVQGFWYYFHLGVPVKSKVGEPSYPLLRVKPSNKELIETTAGAELTVRTAKTAYRAWKTRTLAPGAAIGPFAFNAEHENLVTIGCHTIEKSEIELLAKTLGWSV